MEIKISELKSFNVIIYSLRFYRGHKIISQYSNDGSKASVFTVEAKNDYDTTYHVKEVKSQEFMKKDVSGPDLPPKRRAGRWVPLTRDSLWPRKRYGTTIWNI